MTTTKDEFTQFEHAGWERVADKYDSVWSSLTRQFIPHLIDDAKVTAGMSVLDVACGPGYLSATAKELGAIPIGIDFSEKMIAIAKEMFPDTTFRQGDAKELPFEDRSFDRVLINFGLLHLSHPEKACAEACRVLKSGGRLGLPSGRGQSRIPEPKSSMMRLKHMRTWMSDCPRGRRITCTGREKNAGKCCKNPALMATR